MTFLKWLEALEREIQTRYIEPGVEERFHEVQANPAVGASDDRDSVH